MTRQIGHFFRGALDPNEPDGKRSESIGILEFLREAMYIACVLSHTHFRLIRLYVGSGNSVRV
ncbi:MAG: hypothetical protein O6942_04505, partial [Bacteroidetes bacterium]|nr:hypothetical protein [Bacteroidota bacterium]